MSGFVILIGVSLLTLVIDLVHVKSIRLRKAIESEPVAVVENGQIVNGNMKEIKKSGGLKAEDVFLAELDTTGKLNIDLFKDPIDKKPGIF